MRRNRSFVAVLQVVFALLVILLSSSYSVAAGTEKKAGRSLDFSFLPYVSYTPETKFAGGVGGVYTFRLPGSSPESRPSSITLSTKYTQERQYEFRLVPDVYFRDGEYQLRCDILYRKFPRKFYGIGNKTLDDDEEPYTLQRGAIFASFQKRIGTALNVGILYEFEKAKLVETKFSLEETKGLLDEIGILRGKRGKGSGVGFKVNWDNRNRLFSPTWGGFCQVLTMFYRDFLGSDYEYTRYSLDLRQYATFARIHTLALRGLADFTSGDPPFHKIPFLGGENVIRGYYMRAYYLGRYRDKKLITAQIEYRVMPVWWRVGLVGFLEYGDVSDKFGNFKLKDFKPTVGLGLRYQFNRDEGVNLRADLAFGEDSHGVHLTIFEGF